MFLSKKLLFDIPIASVSLTDLPTIIETFIKKKGKKTFFYVNAHCITIATRDSIYKTILQNADIVYSGGIGPIWAAKILKKPQKSPPDGKKLQKHFVPCNTKCKNFFSGGIQRPSQEKRSRAPRTL